MEMVGWFIGGMFIGIVLFLTVIVPRRVRRFIVENSGKTLKQTVGEKNYIVLIREI